MNEGQTDTASPQPEKQPLRTIRRPIHRLLRWLLIAALCLVLLGMAGWMALAVAYADLHHSGPRVVRAAMVSILPLIAVVLIRPRKAGLALFAFVFAGVLVWYFSLKPSQDRDWQTDVARMPHADINGDRVTLFDIRNFDYRSETDYTPGYETQTYDLAQIQTIDLILSYWAGPAIAHAMLSFGFADGRYVAVSIETRKEKGEEYSAVQGFFRQYELIYVVADERDVVRLRTNYRHEEVYVYRLRATPAKARAVFLDYLADINSLYSRARFYNALTANCATSVFAHLRTPPAPIPRFTLGVLLSGYSAEYAYENGGLDHSMPFEELKQRSHINDLGEAADKAPDFSQRIRARLTAPQPPSPGRP